MISPIGTSNDYHPHSDIRLGDQFLHQVYEAVTNSSAWERTVLVVNFDEWGGFYDHVVPPEGPSSTDWQAQRGFRVPCLVASPYARRGHVAHDVYDHASVLRMIEWGFGVAPRCARDADAHNHADVLDRNRWPDPEVPHWDFPAFTPENCLEAIGERMWGQLRQIATGSGFA
jgi:phospholipase C